MSGAKLIYFNGRGRAEIIRLVLGYLEIEYEEVYLTEKAQIEKLRADGKLLYLQVPVLEIDGRIWSQGGAIVRYLARKGRIYGDNDLDASRGRAEIIRLVLGYLEIEYEEVYLTEKAQIEKLRADGKLLYLQVPVLEIDGRIWSQGGAIVRYLARKGRIYGDNDLDASRIDELYEGTRDFWIAFAAMGFQEDAQALQTSLISKTMPRYLPIFNKILEDNGSGYLYGESLTMADLGLLEALLMVHEYFGTNSMDAFPAVQKFYTLMTEDNKIKAFLNSPHRKGKNDEVYVSTVMKVLT